MHTYIVDESNQKKAIVLSLEEFEQLQKTLSEYKLRLEELEDELDLKIAKEIVQKDVEKTSFDLNNYIHD
jgi:PHD/YefM family antitoxin component YafN of YafNO toxin-antitoxin module